MVPSVRDRARQWDGSCCALKLVKLAAGDFDPQHLRVLGGIHLEQPSWAIPGSSPTASENKAVDGSLSANIDRSVRGMMW